MTYGLTPTGFITPTIEEIKADQEAALLDKISPTLDLSANQPWGQAVGVFAQREAILWEALATVVNARNPDAAEGFLAEFIAAITGTLRRSAKKSTVTLTCNVDAAFSALAGTITVNVIGDDTTRFVNKNNEGPLTEGNHPIVFECTVFGPVVANAGTLTEITTPVGGLNSVTNALDATLGAFEESDTAMMARRDEELTSAGACTVDSERTDLLEVTGVQQAFVFENTSLVTDGDGLPGKSSESVIFDGLTPQADNVEVATAVWNSKPSGAETYGSITTNIVDKFGTTRTVKWSRATVKQVYLNFVDVEIDPEEFPSDGLDAIKSAVAAYALKKQNLAIDVIALGMKAAAMTVPGVIDVPTLLLGFSPGPVASANLTITGREIASIDTSRISVSTVEGTT